MGTAVSFSYDGLQEKTKKELEAKASLIHTRGKRVAQDIVDIGHALLEAKRLLGHGRFLLWAEQETGLNRQRVNEFTRVAQFVDSGKCPNSDISVLYLLSSPGVPQAAIQQVKVRTEEGTPPTVSEVKAIIREEKQSSEPVIMRAAPTHAPSGMPWAYHNAFGDLDNSLNDLYNVVNRVQSMVERYGAGTETGSANFKQRIRDLQECAARLQALVPVDESVEVDVVEAG